MKHLHAFGQGIGDFWVDQINLAAEFLWGQSTNAKSHDTIKKLILAQSIAAAEEKKHDQNETHLLDKPYSVPKKFGDSNSLERESKHSLEEKNIKHTSSMITLSMNNKLRVIGESNDSTEIIPDWVDNKGKEGFTHKFRNSDATIWTFSTGLKNFRGLLREFKRFFRVHVSFSKNISKMDLEEYMSNCIEFLNWEEFIQGVQNTINDTKESKITLESFNLSFLIQNIDCDSQKYAEVVDIDENDLKDKKILHATNLGLLLYPQKMLKTKSEGTQDHKYAGYLDNIKNNTLIVNDLLLSFNMSRLNK